jgi:Flp pilus assembly protein TadD
MPHADILKKLTAAIALIALGGCSFVQHGPSTASNSAAERSVLSKGEYRRAVNALKAGRNDDALDLFNSVARSHPDLAPPYINVGLIEIKKNNLHRAETALLRAATLSPEQPEIYNGLGIVYRRLGRFADAEASYLKALHFAPDYANAHLNLGILYEIYLNNLNAALDHYRRYQTITGSQNDLVKKWIIDVEHRLAVSMGAKK